MLIFLPPFVLNEYLPYMDKWHRFSHVRCPSAHPTSTVKAGMRSWSRRFGLETYQGLGLGETDQTSWSRLGLKSPRSLSRTFGSGARQNFASIFI